jgi:hypothetical protein
MATEVEQTYRYVRPSTVGKDNGSTDVLLSTSGGTTTAGRVEHPHFFDGFLRNGEQTATAMLAVATVARTRFYVPPGMLAAVLRAADPVVTSNGDRLRFESFSACGGVYARLDLLAGGFDGTIVDSGTTNVDFNPPMREALAKVAGLDPLHLRVGENVTVTTIGNAITETKVPLPDRWLRGFAQVQLTGSTMQRVLELPAAEARQFLLGLPTSSGPRTQPMFAAPAGRGARLTSRGGPETVPLAGPERLRVVIPLLRFSTALRVYASSDAVGASVWELDLRDARFVITLSPDVSRGFSGEGGVLWDLADDESAEDADTISALLAFEPRIDVDALARNAALSKERVRRALGWLGAAGRVGFDCAEAAYFHRELPYERDALESMHPRLRDARVLLQEDAVRVDPADPNVSYVLSGNNEYLVRRTTSGLRCSCPWHGKYKGERGPCKHALAAQLYGRG